MIIGTSALSSASAEQLKKAHIGWLRHGFGMPFVDKVGGKLSERYLKSKEQAQAWVDRGFGIMGVSHGLGIGTYVPDAAGDLQLQWKSALPDWYGAPGSDRFNQTYRDVCQFLAEDLREVAAAWQIANELDIPQFYGPLSAAEAATMLEMGARGLKAGNPEAIIGPNMGGILRGYYLFGRLFRDAADVLDYAGIDGYFGTWDPGSPETWDERIGLLHELTGKPVMVNEWGFASRGGLMAPDELPPGAPNCQAKKWKFTWGAGHTEAGQADFVRETFASFAKHREHLAGVLFYRWEDQSHCWQCGESDCPIETAWGLVDGQGNQKPSFHAFKEGVEALLGYTA